MRTPAVDASSVLEQARDLYKIRRYGSVSSLLESDLDLAIVGAEPELAIILVSALDHQFRFADATDAIRRFDRLILLSGNEGLGRRWANLRAGQMLRRGELDGAAQLLSSTLGAAEMATDGRATVIAANGLGIIASIRGHVDEALRYYGRALHAALQKGDSINIGRSRYNMALVLREWGFLEASEQNFTLASDYFQRSGTPQEVVFLTAERSLLFLMKDDTMLAESLSAFSLRRARVLRNDFLLASSLRCRAVVLTKRGMLATARRHLVEAADVLGPGGDPLIRAEVVEELAIVGVLQGRSDSGESLREAEAIYARIGAPRQVERMRRRYDAAMSVT